MFPLFFRVFQNQILKRKFVYKNFIDFFGKMIYTIYAEILWGRKGFDGDFEA